MNPIIFLRRTLTILFFSFLMLNLNACFMMPLMFGTIHNAGMSDNEEPKVGAVVRELIEESVGALDDERGLFDRILIGEIKVNGDLISVRKFRQTLLEALRARNMGQFLEQDDRANSAIGSKEWPIPETQEVLTVLNTQFYQTVDQLWLAHQLVDMRTDRIIWSRIYVRPLPNSTQEPGDDTSLTIGS